MDKKYQIFISSTYEDLKEERAAVIEAILKLGQIPIGMEAFTASNKKMALLERAIDLSDYYILIIGECYGTIYDDGRSYTEVEYDYAVKSGKTILAFIKKHIKESGPEDPKRQNKLTKFRKKVKDADGISMSWDNKGDLSTAVTASLHHQFQDNPQRGWIHCRPVYEDCAETIERLPALGVKNLHHPCESMNFTQDFRKVNSIKLMFVTGGGFFRAHDEKLRLALNNGAEIKVILATKQSDYIKEVRTTEKKDKQFDIGHDIDVELDQVEETLKNLRTATSNGKIFVGHSNTQLRANIAIIDDNFAFYTPTLPPKLSSKSLTLELSKGKILDDCIKHFDTLYEILKGKEAVEEIAE